MNWNTYGKIHQNTTNFKNFFSIEAIMIDLYWVLTGCSIVDMCYYYYQKSICLSVSMPACLPACVSVCLLSQGFALLPRLA